MICTVETDIGITGIGEGGSKDTLEQCAGTLIGKDPFKIEAIWQEMFIAWFYPPGREKIHAVGAMDLALWDIKGKALGLPVHELLGGSGPQSLRVLRHRPAVRPAGAGTGPIPLRDRARAAMDAGYRAFRMGAADVPIGDVYNTHEMVRRVARGVQGSARRRRRRTATGASTSISASTTTTRCAPAARSRSTNRISSRTRFATSTRCRISPSCAR